MLKPTPAGIFLGYLTEFYHDLRMRMLFITSPYAKALEIKSYWQMTMKTRVNMLRVPTRYFPRWL